MIHGTRAAYITNKCRCNPCRRANSLHDQKRYPRVKTYKKQVQAVKLFLWLGQMLKFGS